MHRVRRGARRRLAEVNPEQLTRGAWVYWIWYDLGTPRLYPVRVLRVRGNRVEITHEFGFAWVSCRELYPCPPP